MTPTAEECMIVSKTQRQIIKRYQTARKEYQVEVDAGVGHFTPSVMNTLCATEDALIDAMVGEGATERAKRLGGYCSALNLAKRYAGIY